MENVTIELARIANELGFGFDNSSNTIYAKGNIYKFSPSTPNTEYVTYRYLMESRKDTDEIFYIPTREQLISWLYNRGFQIGYMYNEEYSEVNSRISKYIGRFISNIKDWTVRVTIIGFYLDMSEITYTKSGFRHRNEAIDDGIQYALNKWKEVMIKMEVTP